MERNWKQLCRSLKSRAKKAAQAPARIAEVDRRRVEGLEVFNKIVYCGSDSFASDGRKYDLDYWSTFTNRGDLEIRASDAEFASAILNVATFLKRAVGDKLAELTKSNDAPTWRRDLGRSSGADPSTFWPVVGEGISAGAQLFRFAFEGINIRDLTARVRRVRNLFAEAATSDSEAADSEYGILFYFRHLCAWFISWCDEEEARFRVEAAGRSAALGPNSVDGADSDDGAAVVAAPSDMAATSASGSADRAEGRRSGDVEPFMRPGDGSLWEFGDSLVGAVGTVVFGGVPWAAVRVLIENARSGPIEVDLFAEFVDLVCAKAQAPAPSRTCRRRHDPDDSSHEDELTGDDLHDRSQVRKRAGRMPPTYSGLPSRDIVDRIQAALRRSISGDDARAWMRRWIRWDRKKWTVRLSME